MRNKLAGAITLLLLAATEARAIDCKDVSTDPTKVLYVVGSSAVRPLLKSLAPKIAAQAAPNNYTLVYGGSGSCNGVNGIAGGTYTIPAGTSLNYYPSTYTDPTQPELTCTTSATSTPVDLGVSDVYVPSCTGAATPSTVGDYLGPTQAMAFVVPAASSQTSITAEEAYVALGFPNGSVTSGGATFTASPWTDSTTLFTRGNTSGTKIILAATIGVPVAKWQGAAQANAGAVFTAVANAASPEKTLGILGTADISDPTKVKALAFANYGQKYAFYADSTATAKDKRNVRDGHYAAIGYAHFIATIDGSGNITKPGADYVTKAFLGTNAITGADFITTVAGSGFVPACAMKVKRTAEGGDLSPYDSAVPCGCGFEKAATGTVPSSCTACTSDSTCGSGKCRAGYCEAK
jgi:hypothetical protein